MHNIQNGMRVVYHIRTWLQHNNNYTTQLQHNLCISLKESFQTFSSCINIWSWFNSPLYWLLVHFFLLPYIHMGIAEDIKLPHQTNKRWQFFLGWNSKKLTEGSICIHVQLYSFQFTSIKRSWRGPDMGWDNNRVSAAKTVCVSVCVLVPLGGMRWVRLFCVFEPIDLCAKRLPKAFELSGDLRKGFIGISQSSKCFRHTLYPLITDIDFWLFIIKNHFAVRESYTLQIRSSVSWRAAFIF